MPGFPSIPRESFCLGTLLETKPTFDDIIVDLEGLGILRSWMLDPAAVRTGRIRTLQILREMENDLWINLMAVSQGQMLEIQPFDACHVRGRSGATDRLT